MEVARGGMGGSGNDRKRAFADRTEGGSGDDNLGSEDDVWHVTKIAPLTYQRRW